MLGDGQTQTQVMGFKDRCVNHNTKPPGTLLSSSCRCRGGIPPRSLMLNLLTPCFSNCQTWMIQMAAPVVLSAIPGGKDWNWQIWARIQLHVNSSLVIYFLWLRGCCWTKRSPEWASSEGGSPQKFNFKLLWVIIGDKDHWNNGNELEP